MKIKKKIRILATGGIVTTFLLVGGGSALAQQIPTPSVLFEKNSARGDLVVDFDALIDDSAMDFPIYANDDFQNYTGLGDGLSTRQEATSALADQGFSPSQIYTVLH